MKIDENLTPGTFWCGDFWKLKLCGRHWLMMASYSSFVCTSVPAAKPPSILCTERFSSFRKEPHHHRNNKNNDNEGTTSNSIKLFVLFSVLDEDYYFNQGKPLSHFQIVLNIFISKAGVPDVNIKSKTTSFSTCLEAILRKNYYYDNKILYRLLWFFLWVLSLGYITTTY